jgi:hypothetical protein
MKDNLIDYRSKSKFVVEIRHEPILDLFDRKGEIISKLHPAIKPELKHWRVQNNDISFLDSLEKPADIAFTELKRFGMGFESGRSLVKFKNYFQKFLYPAYENYYIKVGTAQRVGFRLLSVLVKKEEENFDVINENIINRFFQKLPIDAPSKDSKIHIVLENGYYLLGPISKERNEEWIHTHFRNTTVEQDGYGIDIDAYATDVDISNAKKFENAVLSILDLARSIEEQLATHLGILNK